MILFAAILMGIATTVLFFNYMKQYNTVAAANETFVEVVAAKQEIKENTKITSGMLQIVEVPATAVHLSTIISPRLAAGSFPSGCCGSLMACSLRPPARSGYAA